ncbi:MAG: BMP family lipoprotein [Stellaceae bacterium]
MKGMIAAAVALCGALGAGATARAGEAFLPAIVYDVGGKADKSFNEAAYRGAHRFEKETGIAVREFEITNETQRAQAFANMARRGASIIVGVGFTQRAAIETVAQRYPDKKFTLIDATSDLPNVQSVVFREQEGSFLVGVLAALASKTHKLGFVGGMDIPLIRKFECGYAQGVKYAKPDAQVFENMTGTTPSAWNDPTKGGELAKSQFDRGADVVYAAAGGTGVGVYQAAKDNGKLAIGVDSNQNYLQPGTMLTSMMKRVDLAVYNAFMSSKNGTWKAGVSSLGLAEGGVGWALDDNNKALITADMKAKVDQAKQDIISGKIKVVDYTAAKSCPD